MFDALVDGTQTSADRTVKIHSQLAVFRLRAL